MKTIFIIAGGIADLPDPELEGSTPLGIAETPSLDALAKCGCCGSLLAVDEEVPLTTANAILSLLGYDFSRGVPDPMELEEFGATDERVAPAYDEPGRESTLRYFCGAKIFRPRRGDFRHGFCEGYRKNGFAFSIGSGGGDRRPRL